MSKRQILVVEDENIVALDIKKKLQRLGYGVAGVVSSGEEALGKAAHIQPDLVLMDIKLRGDVDGIEAAEQIQTRLDIPVVYLTAYADDPTLQRAKMTAPFGYILKPFVVKELNTTIEIALYRHKMERKLKEHEQWLATTLKSIGDAVIATDIKGYITFMNPVAEALTGWKQEEALRTDVTEVFNIVHERTRATLESPVTKALREGAVIDLANHNAVLISRDGTERPVDDSAAPIRDDKGNITGAVLVFRDITERKRAEDEIRRHKDELEQLVQVRAARIQELERQRTESEKLAATGRMAARIAHEINNPLAGIKNSFMLIKEAIPKDHQYYEYVGRIESEVARITRIVHQMFDLYRPERESPREFSASDAIRDVVALLEPRCRQYEVTITVEIPDTSLVVYLPEASLRQVLFNVLVNAIEASPRGGLVNVAVTVTEDHLSISVADQGSGIPEDMRSQIFEPFFTTKSRHPEGGLGLGLSISKNLLEAMEGFIDFHSHVGQGTVFRIDLPRHGQPKDL